MNVWFRRLLLILTIGGGFVGVARTIQFFSHVDKVIAYVVLLAFVCLYGYGIFLGVKLSEAPHHFDTYVFISASKFLSSRRQYSRTDLPLGFRQPSR